MLFSKKINFINLKKTLKHMTNHLNDTLATLQKEFEAKAAQARELAKNGKLFNLKIFYDKEPKNPREFDKLGTISGKHRRYNFSDNRSVSLKDCDSWGEALEKIKDKVGAHAVILPIYCYEHGNLKFSTEPFDCKFDSGQVGFIYALRNSRGLGVEKITEILKQEVKAFNAYINGEVYCYEISNAITGEVVESCGGFHSEEAAKQAGEELLKDFNQNNYLDEKIAIAGKETSFAEILATPDNNN